MSVVMYMNMRFTTRMEKQRNEEEQKPRINTNYHQKKNNVYPKKYCHPELACQGVT